MFDFLLSKENKHDPQQWASFFEVSIETIASVTSLPIWQLQSEEVVSSQNIQNRFNDIYSILESVSPWFDSIDAALLWLRSAPIAEFCNLSPSEIIGLYDKEGVRVIYDCINHFENTANLY